MPIDENKPSAPSNVEQSTWNSSPIGIGGVDYYSTKVTDSNGNSVERSGNTQEEANQKAGDAFNNGERDYSSSWYSSSNDDDD